MAAPPGLRIPYLSCSRRNSDLWTGREASRWKPAVSRISQRNGPMFFPRHDIAFILQHAQRAVDARAGFPGLDHVVYKTALGGDERISEPLSALRGFLRAHPVLVRPGGELAAVHDV